MTHTHTHTSCPHILNANIHTRKGANMQRDKRRRHEILADVRVCVTQVGAYWPDPLQSLGLLCVCPCLCVCARVCVSPRLVHTGLIPYSPWVFCVCAHVCLCVCVCVCVCVCFTQVGAYWPDPLQSLGQLLTLGGGDDAVLLTGKDTVRHTHTHTHTYRTHNVRTQDVVTDGTCALTHIGRRGRARIETPAQMDDINEYALSDFDVGCMCVCVCVCVRLLRMSL